MPATGGRSPSLEHLVEDEILPLEILHPGGLAITRELAEWCHVREGTRLLDVASGTGESACFLAREFRCEVVAVDISGAMVQRAKTKAVQQGMHITFLKGDAHALPFRDGAFDAVISECTTCLLDKSRAIAEMVRVASMDGYVGIHDVCWKEDTPSELKRRLAEIEGERPETIEGWCDLFRSRGLHDVKGIDRSHLIPGWPREIRRKLGVGGQLRLLARILSRWGIKGYGRIAESERIFGSRHTGYGIIVGRKTSTTRVPAELRNNP